MFEAFRCGSQPPRAASQPPAVGAATPPAPAQARPAKRRKQHGDGPASPPPPPPAASGGLALEKMGDAPLRLVIVGHNPSAHAWSSGHFYSNPSNWFWRILRDTGIAPPAAIRGAADDDKLPAAAGVGLTDVGSGEPGTDSSAFSPADFARWRPAFYDRLAAQMRRASAAVPGCTCGRCGAPALIAFSGKRQFQELFDGGGGGSSDGGRGAKKKDAAPEGVGSEGVGSGEGGGGGELRLPTLQARRPGSIPTGRQWVLPAGWPLPLSTEVWVMTSTSGAAPMTREARYAPWQALAERLRQEPWPRTVRARCGGG